MRGHVMTASTLLREGVRLTTDTDQSLARTALHSLAASDVSIAPMRALADLLLKHPDARGLLDVKAGGLLRTSTRPTLNR